MRTVLIGAVESTRLALRMLAAAPGWSLTAVVTLPPQLSGRHSDFVDLTADAERAGASIIHSATSDGPAFLSAVAGQAPDILFVIGWSRMCRADLLAIPTRGAIGYHPAPLPRLRGRGVLPWTILLDEPITAGTLFWMDDGVDTGAIAAQRFFHVAPDETAATLYERHQAVLEQMLATLTAQLLNGTAPRTPQDERCATWAARRTAEDGRIDWREPAHAIARLVRAVGRPYPGAFTTIAGDRLILWDAAAKAEPARHAAMPGQIVELRDGGFSVMCGDGRLLDVRSWEQPSGKPPPRHARLGLST